MTPAAVPALFLYCRSDDEDDNTKMIMLEPATTIQRVIVWRCPVCGQIAREYPNHDAGSSARLIVWSAKPDGNAY